MSWRDASIVFEAEPEEIAAKAAALPTDCIVEAEILHFPLGQTLERRPGARIVGLRSSTVLDLSAIDAPLTAFTAMVSGSGAPLVRRRSDPLSARPVQPAEQHYPDRRA